MILSCPKCSVGYKISPTSLPEEGTYAHCKNCEYVFFVRPKKKQKEEIKKTAVPEKPLEKEPVLDVPVAESLETASLYDDSLFPTETPEEYSLEPSTAEPFQPAEEPILSQDLESEEGVPEPAGEPLGEEEAAPVTSMEFIEEEESAAIGFSLEEPSPDENLADIPFMEEPGFQTEDFAKIATEIGSKFDPNDFIDSLEENPPSWEKPPSEEEEKPLFSFSSGEPEGFLGGDRPGEELMIETSQVPVNPELEKTPTDVNQFLETLNVEPAIGEEDLTTGQWEMDKIEEMAEREGVFSPEPEEPTASVPHPQSAESEEFLAELLKEGRHSEEVSPGEIDDFLDSVESETAPDSAIGSMEPEEVQVPPHEKASLEETDSHAFLDSLLGGEEEGKAVPSVESGGLDSDLGAIDLGGEEFDFEPVSESGEGPSSRKEPVKVPPEEDLLSDLDSLFESGKTDKGSPVEEDGLDVFGKESGAPAKVPDLAEDADLFDLAGTEELVAAGADLGEPLESMSEEESVDLGDIDSIFGSTESGEVSSGVTDLLEKEDETLVRAGEPADTKKGKSAGKAILPDDLDFLFSASDATGGGADEMEAGPMGQDDIDSLLGETEKPARGAPGAKSDRPSSGLEDLDDLFSAEPAGTPSGKKTAKAMDQTEDIDSLLGDMDMGGGTSFSKKGDSDLGDLDDMFSDSPAPTGGGKSGGGSDELDDLLGVPAGSGGGGGMAAGSFASEDDIDDLMATTMGDLGDSIFDADMDGGGEEKGGMDSMMGGDRDILEDSIMVNTSMLEAFQEGDDEESVRHERAVASEEVESLPERIDEEEEDEERHPTPHGVPEFVKKISLSVNAFLARFSRSKGEAAPQQEVLDEDLFESASAEGAGPRRGGFASRPFNLKRHKVPVAIGAAVLLVFAISLMYMVGTEEMMGKTITIEKGKMAKLAKKKSRASEASFISEDEKKKKEEMTKAPLEGEVPEDLLAGRQERLAEQMAGLKEKKETEGKEESIPMGFPEESALQEAAAVPSRGKVQLGAILPIELNAEATRILVVNVTLELDSPLASRYISDRVPFYEGILESSIENFFADKFYEETNYAQEKLRQYLLTELNKDKRFGRVMSVRLDEFKVS